MVSLLAGTTISAQQPAKASAARAMASSTQQSTQASLVTTVRDTGFVQLKADSFNDLTSDQKVDAYWLSMAAIAVADWVRAKFALWIAGEAFARSDSDALERD